MSTSLSLLCLYLACVAFYQAAPRRTAFMRVRKSVPLQHGMTGIAWVLSALALILMIGMAGFERGFPIWLGLFMLAGMASLIVSAFRPDWHVKSIYAVTALCGVSGTLALTGG